MSMVRTLEQPAVVDESETANSAAPAGPTPSLVLPAAKAVSIASGR